MIMSYFRCFFVLFIDQFEEYVKIYTRFEQQTFEKNSSIFSRTDVNCIIDLHLSIIINIFHVVVVIYNALRSVQKDLVNNSIDKYVLSLFEVFVILYVFENCFLNTMSCRHN